MLEIKRATLLQLEPLIALFDQYRQFYQMPSDEKHCLDFLKQRINQQDSIILLAYNNQRAAGFVQIYPVYSSVAMRPSWLLNDLFVSPLFRRKGIAKELMLQVEKRANEAQVFSIKLATAIDNDSAKKLYLSLGYNLVDKFEHYSKRL